MTTRCWAEAPEDEATMVAALRALRARDGRSIRALSAATGIPASTLGGFFSGRHLPVHEDTWGQLLEGLGVRDRDAVIAWARAGRELARQRRRRESGRIEE